MFNNSLVSSKKNHVRRLCWRNTYECTWMYCFGHSIRYESVIVIHNIKTFAPILNLVLRSLRTFINLLMTISWWRHLWYVLNTFLNSTYNSLSNKLYNTYFYWSLFSANQSTNFWNFEKIWSFCHHLSIQYIV